MSRVRSVLEVYVFNLLIYIDHLFEYIIPFQLILILVFLIHVIMEGHALTKMTGHLYVNVHLDILVDSAIQKVVS